MKQIFLAMEKASGRKPGSRLGHGYYNDHAPREVLVKSFGIARQVERAGGSVEQICPEVENTNHTTMGKSPRGTAIEILRTSPEGATLYHQILEKYKKFIKISSMRFNSILIIIFLLIFSISTVYADGYEKYRDCVVMAEQSQNQIAIANIKTGRIIWNWKPTDSSVAPEHYAWFSNPSDAKVVYGGKYVLMSASGGACALIRIADKKIMFYAKAGHNPHSAELLPDGNIICAASDGNCLTVFKTDTVSFPDRVIQRSFFCDFAHNVVWDKKRALLWTADKNKIRSFKYSFSNNTPALQPVDSLKFEDESGHDLFPVPGQDALFFTSQNKTWNFGIQNKMLKGNSILQIPGLKIYKARWIVENSFSYPDFDSIRSY